MYHQLIREHSSKKELGLLNNEVNFLETTNQKFFENTQELKVFNSSQNNIIRVVIPPSKYLIQITKKFFTRVLLTGEEI